MDEFVAISQKSKDVLKVATLSSTLPVNVVIVGEKAVGKNHLAKVVAPNAVEFEAVEADRLLLNRQLNLDENDEIILHNLQKVPSQTNLIKNLISLNKKVIITTTEYREFYDEYFQVKIEVPPLREREDDVDVLVRRYISEAKRVFLADDKEIKPIIDLSNNAISLKKSVYSAVIFDSISEGQLVELLENFIDKKLENTTEYKELLPLFEIPLLKATKKRFGSQLQMAKKLDINRNTLRKKLMENGLYE